MTSKQAILIDLILTDFLKKENKNNIGLVDLNKVIKSNKDLKTFTKDEINDLLYIARLKQKDFPTLFEGSTLLSVNQRAVSDFLRHGGFTSLQKKEFWKSIAKWTLFITTLFTFILVAIQVYLQVTTLKTSEKERTELKQELRTQEWKQKRFLSDSLNTRYHEPKSIDSLKVETDSLK